jgi:hypothetical protein
VTERERSAAEQALADELTVLAAELADNAETERQLRARRDQLIKNAARRGWGTREIGKLAGISHNVAAQIIRGYRTR